MDAIETSREKNTLDNEVSYRPGGPVGAGLNGPKLFAIGVQTEIIYTQPESADFIDRH